MVGSDFGCILVISSFGECARVGVELAMTHPHPLPAAGVPATPHKSPAVTSND